MAVNLSRFSWLGARLAVRAAIVALLAATLGPASATAQAPPGLSIAGDVAKPVTWTLAELKAMPRTAVTVQESGQPVVYEGVLAGELLGRAGVPVGRDLTGSALTTYVKAIAADGYEVVFSIGELGPALTSDARSVRMLVRLELVRVKK